MSEPEYYFKPIMCVCGEAPCPGRTSTPEECSHERMVHWAVGSMAVLESPALEYGSGWACHACGLSGKGRDDYPLDTRPPRG